MQRVIRDSDDESDVEDELCSPVRGNGTGSTESLRNKIEAAHRDLVAPTQSPSHKAANRNAISILHTTGDITRNPTIAINSTVPSVKDAHTRSDRVLENNHSRLMQHTSPATAENRPYNSTNTADPDMILEAPIDSTLPATYVPNGPWELPGSIQDDFEHHQPLAMFPEMSSTVPNNTQTQQRLMDELLRSHHPNMPVAMPLPDQTTQNSSIPWSAYMTTPSENRDAPEDSIRQSGDSLGNEHAQPQASSRTPTVHTDQAQSATESKTGKEASGSAELIPVDNRRIAERTRSQSVPDNDNSPKTKPRLEKRKPTPTIKQHGVIDLEDDDEAFGLPKERYRPRPSRSRSTNVILEDPIDFSVRPEKAKKSRSKRNNTTGSIGHLVLSSSEKAERICAMGFSPSNAKQALKACDNRFDQAVEWLLNRPGSSKGQHDTAVTAQQDPSLVIAVELEEKRKPNVAELQSPTKGQVRELLHVAIPAVRSPLRRKTDESEECIEHNTRVQDHGDINNVITTKVLPEGKTLGPNTMHHEQLEKPKDVTTDGPRTKRRKTTALEEAGDTIPTSVPLHSPGEKKRGRGRPRRAEKEVETLIAPHEEARMSVDESVSTEAVHQVHDKCETREGIPRGTEMTSVYAIGTTLPPNTPPDTTIDGTTSNSSVPKPETKSQKPKKGTGGSLSPSGKSKVPLRVGLSKRARIAPLLRVMRK
ncbi:hypothetical protein BU16DRAFT_617788 [Lophium mytilinum]|uniref:UBA domain-containing protein n=1 Tax=Lophium mytilinum TaxID=390894 RepID=A0A6A6QV80_9PEZI|nr:hypothetical protein BU16DRAFT_617788 [Lophium mytilinum]